MGVKRLATDRQGLSVWEGTVSVAHSVDDAQPNLLGNNAIEKAGVTSCRDQPREGCATYRGIDAAE